MFNLVAAQVITSQDNGRVSADDRDLAPRHFILRLFVVSVDIVIWAPPVHLLVFDEVRTLQHNGFTVFERQ